jgi:hypothetical protein
LCRNSYVWMDTVSHNIAAAEASISAHAPAAILHIAAKSAIHGHTLYGAQFAALPDRLDNTSFSSSSYSFTSRASILTVLLMMSRRRLPLAVACPQPLHRHSNVFPNVMFKHNSWCRAPPLHQHGMHQTGWTSVAPAGCRAARHWAFRAQLLSRGLNQFREPLYLQCAADTILNSATTASFMRLQTYPNADTRGRQAV